MHLPQTPEVSSLHINRSLNYHNFYVYYFFSDGQQENIQLVKIPKFSDSKSPILGKHNLKIIPKHSRG